jgi:hypothetical protein
MALLLAPTFVGVAACSDDDPSASSSAPTSSSSEEAPTTALPAGDPIRLGIISNSEWLALAAGGAEAAVARINDAGGIHGRPLELVSCDNENNANAAAACAQQFAADGTLFATVGDVSSFGGDTNPPLEEAGVAGVGTVPLGFGDFAAPRVFATTSGGLEFLGIASFLHDELGAGGIGMATIDDPTAQALPVLVNGVLAPRGTELAATVVIPLASADVSSSAAALAGTDAQALALTEDLALRYVRAARQQGFTGPLMLSETVVPPTALEENLSPTDLAEVYAITWFDKTSDGYADYLSDLEQYQPDVEPSDLGVNAWLSVNMFAEVAGGLDEVTRASVFAAMNALSGYDTGGLTPPLDFTVEGTALGGAAPRLVPSAQTVFADRYEDGQWVPYAEEQEPILVFE